MDWSKAKTILIISFVIVNILLIYTFFQDGEQADMTLEEDFIQDSINLLTNKGIIIETEIPKEIPKLTSLIVEYETLETEELNENFYNNKGIIVDESEDFIEIIMDKENATIINKKLLIYTSLNKETKYDISNEDLAIDFAWNFLKDKNINTDDMELSFIKSVDEEYFLEFSKKYDERYLESSFTNMKLNNTGVEKMERLWLNVIDKGESEIYIGSAPKSILGLLSMNEVYGKTVSDISLCYYFDPEKHEYIQDPKSAQEGRTIPAWRIQFDDGYRVFIDNY